MQRFTLIYDADCGPCKRFRRAVGFLDSYGRLDYASLVDADRLGLLDQVPPARRHRSFHLITPSRTVLSGAKAIPELVGLLPSGALLSRLVVSTPLVYRSMAFVYSTFSRIHDSSSCTYEAFAPSGGRPKRKNHFETAAPALVLLPVR